MTIFSVGPLPFHPLVLCCLLVPLSGIVDIILSTILAIVLLLGTFFFVVGVVVLVLLGSASTFQAQTRWDTQEIFFIIIIIIR